MTRHMDRISSPAGEHPADVWIEPLPWFGTTWYERGPAYWWRRAAVSLVLLLSVAILLPFVYSALAAISTWGRGALVITLAVMASTGAATAAWMWRHWWVDVPTPSRRAAGAAAGGGAAIGVLARAGSLLGAAFVLIGALTILVPMVVLFLFSLGPQLPPERRARLRLEHRDGRAAG